jgi:hypothetical protein
MHQRVDAERTQRTEIALDDVVRIRLHHHLVLVVALQAVRVLAVTPIGGTTRGLHVGRVPRFRPQCAQEGGGMEGAGTDFEVERLDQHATLLGPIVVEDLDQLLERRRRHGGNLLFSRSALV